MTMQEGSCTLMLHVAKVDRAIASPQALAIPDPKRLMDSGHPLRMHFHGIDQDGDTLTVGGGEPPELAVDIDDGPDGITREMRAGFEIAPHRPDEDEIDRWQQPLLDPGDLRVDAIPGHAVRIYQQVHGGADNIGDRAAASAIEFRNLDRAEMVKLHGIRQSSC